MTEDHTDAVRHRVVCPNCGSNDTERLSVGEPMDGVDSGTTLVENRSCENCYAGYRLTYTVQDSEVHHEPEVEA